MDTMRRTLSIDISIYIQIFTSLYIYTPYICIYIAQPSELFTLGKTSVQAVVRRRFYWDTTRPIRRINWDTSDELSQRITGHKGCTFQAFIGPNNDHFFSKHGPPKNLFSWNFLEIRAQGTLLDDEKRGARSFDQNHKLRLVMHFQNFS